MLTPRPPLPVQLFSALVFSLCHLLCLTSASLWLEIRHTEGILSVASIQGENGPPCFLSAQLSAARDKATESPGGPGAADGQTCSDTLKQF